MNDSEAHRFRHDFAKITKFGCFTSKGTIYRVPEKVIFFLEKVSAYCRCKNATFKNLTGFVVLSELTWVKRALTENRKLQIFLTLAQTSAPGLKTGYFKCFLH